MSNRPRKRIFYESIFSTGTFPDERIKLDVYFRSESGDEFIWTPQWRAIIDLSAAARYIEETNKPKSEWTNELKESYEKMQQTIESSKRIIEVADTISATLHPLTGDSAPGSLFPGIPPDIKKKSKQIFFVLSNAKDIDEFMTKLSPLVNVHRRYFNEPFKQNFNRILRKLGLKLDTNLNVVKIE